MSICAVLGGADFDALCAIGLVASYGPRADLFMEGQSADTVFVITSGLSNLFRLLPDGRRQVVGFALPGDFLGLPRTDHHKFSAATACATTVCGFNRRDFTQLADRHLGLLRRLHEAAVRSLDGAHSQMTVLSQRRPEVKIAIFLAGLRERWERIGHTSLVVPLPMGRQDIGDALAMSISTVSRTLTRLDRDGVIRIVPHGVRILDLPRLLRLADSTA